MVFNFLFAFFSERMEMVNVIIYFVLFSMFFIKRWTILSMQVQFQIVVNVIISFGFFNVLYGEMYNNLNTS